jgi:LPS O-antigen subunit length determinant protein (WzzB/FepE family)
MTLVITTTALLLGLLLGTLITNQKSSSTRQTDLNEVNAILNATQNTMNRLRKDRRALAKTNQLLNERIRELEGHREVTNDERMKLDSTGKEHQ